jgi:uncharacterized protein
MTENPFVYGEVVPASAFVDREQELERLTSDLLAGQKVFLISPRRYGKSSLVQQALRAASRRNALAVDVTVSSYSSYVAFLEGYARAVLVADARPERIRTWIADLLGAVRPHLQVDPGSRMAISFPSARTRADVARLAEAVFALPARIAEVRRRRLVVALDEFQAIHAFDQGSNEVEHALRAAIQHQRQVGYVFSGSEPTLMERMLSRSRPFYKAGPVIRLDRIPADLFAGFIEAQFQRTGFRAEGGLGAAVVELAGNLPYDVQRLAHETWDDARAGGMKRVGLDALHATLRRLLNEHHVLYETLWQRLTVPQRGTLRAAVLEEGRELLSADVRARHRLSGPSTVQASLAALVRDDVLAREGSRYTVVDSLLREWVARRTY